MSSLSQVVDQLRRGLATQASRREWDERHAVLRLHPINGTLLKHFTNTGLTEPLVPTVADVCSWGWYLEGQASPGRSILRQARG